MSEREKTYNFFTKKGSGDKLNPVSLYAKYSIQKMSLGGLPLPFADIPWFTRRWVALSKEERSILQGVAQYFAAR